MSTEQTVESYLKGAISRRIFVRRLVAAGITLSAAMAYSDLLAPASARASTASDHYAQDLYKGDLNAGAQNDGPPPQPSKPVDAGREVPFAASLALSKGSVTRMLLTGRLNVVIGATLPGAVTLTAVFRPSGRGKKAQQIARKKLQLSSGNDGRSVTLKVGRTSRKAMRAAGGQLVVTSVTDSPGRTPLTKTAAVAVSRAH